MQPSQPPRPPMPWHKQILQCHVWRAARWSRRDGAGNQAGPWAWRVSPKAVAAAQASTIPSLASITLGHRMRSSGRVSRIPLPPPSRARYPGQRTCNQCCDSGAVLYHTVRAERWAWVSKISLTGGPLARAPCALAKMPWGLGNEPRPGAPCTNSVAKAPAEQACPIATCWVFRLHG